MYFLYLLNLFFSISILLFRPSGKVVFTSYSLHFLKTILFHHPNVSYVQKQEIIEDIDQGHAQLQCYMPAA